MTPAPEPDAAAGPVVRYDPVRLRDAEKARSAMRKAEERASRAEERARRAETAKRAAKKRSDLVVSARRALVAELDPVLLADDHAEATFTVKLNDYCHHCSPYDRGHDHQRCLADAVELVGAVVGSVAEDYVEAGWAVTTSSKETECPPGHSFTARVESVGRATARIAAERRPRRRALALLAAGELAVLAAFAALARHTGRLPAAGVLGARLAPVSLTVGAGLALAFTLHLAVAFVGLLRSDPGARTILPPSPSGIDIDINSDIINRKDLT